MYADARRHAASLNRGYKVDSLVEPGTIVCSAWISEDGKTTYYGVRHPDCYKEAVRRNGGTEHSYPDTADANNKPGFHPSNQGFALADGTFVDREQGAKIAFDNGQINGVGLSEIHKAQTLRLVDNGKQPTDCLTSEHLW